MHGKHKAWAFKAVRLCQISTRDVEEHFQVLGPTHNFSFGEKRAQLSLTRVEKTSPAIDVATSPYLHLSFSDACVSHDDGYFYEVAAWPPPWQQSVLL